MLFIWIYGSVLAVSLISLIGIATLSIHTERLRRVLFILVSLATGALLGDAIIHLIPEAFEKAASPLTVSLVILLGLISFFVLEKFLRWHHFHSEEEFSPDHSRIHPLGYLVIVGDGFHNMIDGLIIGSSYFISLEIGIATTTAVILHEIPQEIGDFGLLIHAGFSRVTALLANFASALLAFVGAGIAVTLGGEGGDLIPLIAAFAAGNFLYIAGSDLVPELHKVRDIRSSLLQLLFILIGIGIMALLLFLE